MKAHQRNFPQAVLARHIQLALLALSMIAVPALAAAGTAEAGDNDDLKALVCPQNFVEIGALNVGNTAPKFGEYTGLNKSGVYGIGNFSVQGGNGYCQRGGAMRWDVHGANLGTTSRNLGVSVGEQGLWSFGVDFDQLRHYTTTGWQSPFQGSPGDNLLVIDPNTVGGLINAQTVGTQRLTGPFTGVDVYNQRDTTTLNAGYAFNARWDVKFEYRRVDQSGAKLIGAGTDTTVFNGLTYRGQGILTLMNPTQYNTDNLKLALNWTGNKAYASLDYYASLFHDDYRGVSFSNPYVGNGVTLGTPPGGAFALNTMGTPPSNQLHRFSFTGGYIFSPATRLTGGLSYGINKQDSSYEGTYTPGTVTLLPVSSLNGKVENTHADARLTHRFTPALNLSVGFRYNERNNKTPSHEYQFYHLGGNAANALINVVNAPMSNRREQFDASLDYRFDKRQTLRLGYAHDHIRRWCNNELANNAKGALPQYNTMATCTQVPDSSENSLTASYRLAMLDSVSFNASYTHADRKATVNPSYYNPIQSFSEGYNNIGYLAFFEASRREDLFKAGVNWQVSEKFSLGLDGRHTRDNYGDTELGVQNGKLTSANLSADYTVSEKASYGAYLSRQQRSRDLLTASGRPTATSTANTGLWFNALTDRGTGAGFYGKQKLKHGKFQLSEDLSYDFGKTRYDTEKMTSTVTAAGSFGATPDIKSKTVQLRLAGTYQLGQASSVTAGYMFQRLDAVDYYYNAYQFGYTPLAVMPTGQLAPYYSINTVFVAYRRTFL
jgi:MtrB/PioB family decaheme-associated outer membrane protein